MGIRECAGLAAILFSVALFSGCKTVEGLVGKINLNVEDVAPYVEKAAASGVKSGLKALSKDQASYDTTKTVAAEVERHITDAVLPLFSGADLNAVTTRDR